MSKKSGLGSLLTGLALGAAAMFLSKKENRDQTVIAAKKAKTKAKKAVKIAKSEGKKIAKATKSKKVSKKVKKSTK